MISDAILIRGILGRGTARKIFNSVGQTFTKVASLQQNGHSNSPFQRQGTSNVFEISLSKCIFLFQIAAFGPAVCLVLIIAVKQDSCNASSIFIITMLCVGLFCNG